MADDTVLRRREAPSVKVSTEYAPRINGEMIRELREGLNQSLSVFGLTLKRAIYPKAKRGFSRQYISGLEHNKPEYRITEEIEAAFWNVAGVFDEMPAGTGGAVIAQVMVNPGIIPDGVVPLIPASAVVMKCQRPGCPVWFIRTAPSQKYHDPSCRARR